MLHISMRMKEQKILREEITKNRDIVLAIEVNAISKEIVKSIKKDEKKYFENGLSAKVDVSKALKSANELLRNQKNLAPTAINEVGKNGVTEIVKNPEKLATLFNKFFINKIKKLRGKSTYTPPYTEITKLA